MRLKGIGQEEASADVAKMSADLSATSGRGVSSPSPLLLLLCGVVWSESVSLCRTVACASYSASVSARHPFGGAFFLPSVRAPLKTLCFQMPYCTMGRISLCWLAWTTLGL